MTMINRSKLLEPYNEKIGREEKEALNTLTAAHPTEDQVQKALSVLLKVIEPQCAISWPQRDVDMAITSSIRNAAADLSENIQASAPEKIRTYRAKQLTDRWFSPKSGSDGSEADAPQADLDPAWPRSTAELGDR